MRVNRRGVTRWVNIDTVGEDRGRVLGGKTYGTMEEAVDAAKKRSKRQGRKHRKSK